MGVCRNFVGGKFYIVDMGLMRVPKTKLLKVSIYLKNSRLSWLVWMKGTNHNHLLLKTKIWSNMHKI